MTTEGLEELLWRGFFSDPTRWWDNRRSTKKPPQNPDYRHKKSKDWLNGHRPAWVESQVATWEAEMKWPSCDSFEPNSAQKLFATVGMCGKLREHGHITEAVEALQILVQGGCRVSNNLFYRVLKRCISHKDLGMGRRIHGLAIKSGYEGDAFLATHLIALYASHGRLEEALRVFTEVSTPDAYNWATIILAYARHGEPREAIRLYRKMSESSVKPDNHIYLAVLKACASAADLAAGKDVHADVLANAGSPDIFVQTCLVDMYAKCGSLENARRVFDKLPHKDVVTWNVMIAGYAQQGMGHEALGLFSCMHRKGIIIPPDSVTFVGLLQACASVGAVALQQGKQLHAQIEEAGLQDNVVVGASLVNMYAKCGSAENARRVFDSLPQKNVVTWNAMMTGYVKLGLCQEALRLYSRMQAEAITSPDAVTFVCLMQACASVGAAALDDGKQLHAQIEAQGLNGDVILGGSLVNMYAKCGSVENSRRVFDRLSRKNVVTWNALIAGYVQHGMGEKAVGLYNRMQEEDITPPDCVTFVCLLQACATLAALPLGKQLHAQIEQRDLQADVTLGTGLVYMYAKCGSMSDSQQMFDSLPERNIEAWNALIAGYTRQGDSQVVFNLLDRMRLEGQIQPDAITFLSVLTACSHVGLVHEGRKHFEAMSTDYGITPIIEHYVCMMDLLGRAGYLAEAMAMAKDMPFQPNGSMWRTLLGACRKWSDVQAGRHIFELAVSSDEKDSSFYVLMSNIYETAEMWEEAKEVKSRRVKSEAWKQPGQSWTDISGVVHTFVVGGKTT